MATKTRTERPPDTSGVKWVTVKGTIKVSEQKPEQPLSYDVPASFTDLVKWAAKLPLTNELAGKVKNPDGTSGRQLPSQEWVYDRHCYAVDLFERQGLRETEAAESTIIVINGKPFDIMTMAPVADKKPASPTKSMAFVNAAYLTAALTGKDPDRAVQTARRKHIENGATEKEGMLVATKK